MSVRVAEPVVTDAGAGVQGTVDGAVVVVGGTVVVVGAVVVVVLGGFAPASAANVRTPASPVTTATDPMSPNRISLLKRRILTPRAFIRPF